MNRYSEPGAAVFSHYIFYMFQKKHCKLGNCYMEYKIIVFRIQGRTQKENNPFIANYIRECCVVFFVFFRYLLKYIYSAYSWYSLWKILVRWNQIRSCYWPFLPFYHTSNQQMVIINFIVCFSRCFFARVIRWQCFSKLVNKWNMQNNRLSRPITAYLD